MRPEYQVPIANGGKQPPYHPCGKHGRQPEALGGSDAYQHLQEIPEADTDSGENAEEADQLSALFHRALEQIRDGFEQRTWQAFWRVTVDGASSAASSLRTRRLAV